ncbi:hypothetical protein SAY87_006355 [Trapa incisa]|uniref:POX domain-containing protein n=1 Tax=Trapa incisa TaxID=236973 RepID=A0AAN7PZ03_9MYRT|nr:hypothetical protein SAY87_006355 [Trapa incisa]
MPRRKQRPNPIAVVGRATPLDSRGGGGNEALRNVDYMSRGFPGTSVDLASLARTILNSQYLKATQQLLDEVVNVKKALKQPVDAKDQSGDGSQNQGKGSEDAVGGGVKHDDGDLNTYQGIFYRQRGLTF